MSNIEPTEEQRQAALRFCKDHSVCGNGWLVDEFTVAELLAEREAKLREDLTKQCDPTVDMCGGCSACVHWLRDRSLKLDTENDTLRAEVARLEALCTEEARLIVERDTLRSRVAELEEARVASIEARRAVDQHRREREAQHLARIAELEAFTLLTDSKRTSAMFAADIAVVTRAVREADQLHPKVGGGTGHYVNECLLPCLKDEGLAIIVVGKAHYDDAKADAPVSTEGGEG